jgi:hypothetical protein
MQIPAATTKRIKNTNPSCSDMVQTLSAVQIVLHLITWLGYARRFCGGQCEEAASNGTFHLEHWLANL